MTAVVALTERRRHMLSGAIGLTIVLSLVVLGIKASFGAFDGGYHVQGSFAAAGQGLISGSDVKIRGVDVGEVSSIELVDNRARIRMRIEDDIRIPDDATATVRPKTLFGEKFIDIDPGPSEGEGPFLADGGVIENTRGGFELEQVLADAYPVLQAIDPVELATVIGELADSGDGLGDRISRIIVNSATLSDLQVSNDAEFRQFLGDLALVSEELDALAPDLVAGARDLHVALPTLSSRGDALGELLRQLSRLSTDLADLFENNRQFIDDSFQLGSRPLDVLYEKRSRLQPLLEALQRYVQVTSEAIRIDVGDGTLMAAVKGISGGEACFAVECDTEAAGAAPAAPAPGAGGHAPSGGDDAERLLDELLGATDRDTGVRGADALLELFQAAVG